MLLEIPVIFVEEASICLSEAQLQGRQFLAAEYPANVKESLVAASQELTSIEVLAGDLEGEDDWDLNDMTGVPSLGS